MITLTLTTIKTTTKNGLFVNSPHFVLHRFFIGFFFCSFFVISFFFVPFLLFLFFVTVCFTVLSFILQTLHQDMCSNDSLTWCHVVIWYLFDVSQSFCLHLYHLQLNSGKPLL